MSGSPPNVCAIRNKSDVELVENLCRGILEFMTDHLRNSDDALESERQVSTTEPTPRFPSKTLLGSAASQPAAPTLLCGGLQTKIEELKCQISVQRSELNSYRQMALKIDEGIAQMEATLTRDSQSEEAHEGVQKLKDFLAETHLQKLKTFLRNVAQAEARPFNAVSADIDNAVSSQIELSLTHTQQLRDAFEQKKRETSQHKLQNLLMTQALCDEAGDPRSATSKSLVTVDNFQTTGTKQLPSHISTMFKQTGRSLFQFKRTGSQIERLNLKIHELQAAVHERDLQLAELAAENEELQSRLEAGGPEADDHTSFALSQIQSLLINLVEN